MPAICLVFMAHCEFWAKYYFDVPDSFFHAKNANIKRKNKCNDAIILSGILKLSFLPDHRIDVIKHLFFSHLHIDDLQSDQVDQNLFGNLARNTCNCPEF